MAWDIKISAYHQNFSVFAQEVLAMGIAFNSDGTKLYIIGTSLGVSEYDLKKPWDVSTAVYLQSFSVSTQETIPTEIAFKSDGTKMYVVGYTGQDVNEYDLSVAWDVSTAVYSQLFSVAARETAPAGIAFKPDGTKMYVTGYISDAVNEYDLSVAWDVSTAIYLQNFSVSTQETSPQGIAFNSDGTKMYVTGSDADSVHEYDLSVAWDVSTAIYLQSLLVSAQETIPTGIAFKSDGTKMYVIGVGGYAIWEYNLSIAWDFMIGDPLASVTDFKYIKVIDSIAGAKRFDAVFNDANGKLGIYNQYEDVQILLDGTVIFRGRIESMIPDFDTNTIEISGKDYLGELLDRYILESYTTKLRSFIVDHIVETYAPSLTRGSIAGSPTGAITRTFKTTAWDVCVECAAEDGFRFWADANKDFHYAEKGYDDSGITITLGTDPIRGFSIEESGADIVNRITVYGAGTGASQIAVMKEDPASQSYYRVIKEHRIIDTQIAIEAEAEAIADTYLAEHAWTLDIVNLDTIGYETLNAGERIRLVLGRYGIDDDYVVITKTHEFPSYQTKIQVARYAKHLEGLIADLIGRILSLERAAVDDDAVIVRFVKFYEGLGLTDTVVIMKRDVNDSFRFGVGKFGVTPVGDRRSQAVVLYSGGGA